MGKNRLEAFSDGVFAIVITIMVLELKRPASGEFPALLPLIPALSSYLLSFVHVGIYWNNHHHLFHATPRVNGAILWANLHLLFWLTLFPFATAWMGETRVMAAPTAAYGVILFLAAIAWYIMQSVIIAADRGAASRLKQALGRDWKGKISPVIYLVAIPVAFANAWVSVGLYALVALIWLVPDRRIEQLFAGESHQ
ncbi:MAG TPA: TMEM175 family protein [Candidatus Solibacter sp.]|nr:TMEM175 family protein [Candidatus Solibacter sp.]